MVTDTATYKRTVDNDRNTVTSWATHDPTRRDLIFAPRTFFCFSANPFAKSKEVQSNAQSQRTIAPHLLLPQPHIESANINNRR